MRFRKIAMLLTAFFFAAPAFAQQALPFTFSSCSISSLTGSSQSLLSANPNRKYLFLFNSGANNAYVDLAGNTATSADTLLVPGSSLVISGSQIPVNAINITGTSSQPFACNEGR